MKKIDQASPFPTRRRAKEMKAKSVDLLVVAGCVHIAGIGHTSKQDPRHLFIW